MKNEVTILIGVPGSGKTTYAEQMLKSSKSLVRVSRDAFRFMFRNDGNPGEEIEDLVSICIESTVQQALKKGWDVILDETHCEAKNLRATINKWGRQARVVLKIIGSELSLKEIKSQNQKRENAVPEGVIDSMYKGFKHIVGNKKDFLNQINELAGIAVTPIIPFKQNHALPKAIIVDIDGTIAKMSGKRGPFEWNKVDGDEPVFEVLNIIRELSKEYKVVFMSGRDESCRELTTQWLRVYYKSSEPIELYMRAAGNCEKDNKVKRDLFNQHIKDKYFVEAVFDDRDQVVKMWREELGLKCLQVDYGNF